MSKFKVGNPWKTGKRALSGKERLFRTLGASEQKDSGVLLPRPKGKIVVAALSDLMS